MSKVSSVVEDHNHDIGEANKHLSIYTYTLGIILDCMNRPSMTMHLPHQRRLNHDKKTEAAKMVEMKVNKNMLQQHLTKQYWKACYST